MAGLAHTAWMFRASNPNATKAAMHDANYPVFTGSYRRGLAFTACACGFSEPSWAPRALEDHPATHDEKRLRDETEYRVNDTRHRRSCDGL